MKVERDVLANAMKHAVRIAKPKSQMPILNMVLLQTGSPGTLFISVSDLKNMLTFSMPCHDGDLDVCVNAKALTALVNGETHPSGEVELVLKDNGKLEVTVDELTSKLPMVPGGGFVVLESLPEKWQPLASMKFADKRESDAFKNNLKWVAIAISDDVTRMNMNGMYFTNDKDDPNGPGRMVASDGSRLHLCQLPTRIKGEGVIVPSGAVTILGHLVDGCDELEASAAGDYVQFKGQNWWLTSRLIQGKFPPYKYVMPDAKTRHYQMEVRSDVAQKVLKRVRALLSKSDESVSLRINHKVSVHANDPDTGEVETEMPVKMLKRKLDVLDVPYNSAYLADAISGSNCTMNWSMDDELSPFIIEADIRTAVIMPRRI